MKKLLTAFIIVLSATSVCAESKKGYAFYGGFTHVENDVPDSVDRTAFNVGYDYTSVIGGIIGISLTTGVASESVSIMNIIYSATAKRDSNTLTVYAGYQFDNNIRLVAGPALTVSTASITITNSPVYGEILAAHETTLGVMAGVGYVADLGLLTEVRVTTASVADVNSVLYSFNIGYKF